MQESLRDEAQRSRRSLTRTRMASDKNIVESALHLDVLCRMSYRHVMCFGRVATSCIHKKPESKAGTGDGGWGLRVSRASQACKSQTICERQTIPDCKARFEFSLELRITIYFGPSMRTLMAFPFFTSSNACSASSKLTFLLINFFTSTLPLLTNSTAVW